MSKLAQSFFFKLSGQNWSKGVLLRQSRGVVSFHQLRPSSSRNNYNHREEGGGRRTNSESYDHYVWTTLFTAAGVAFGVGVTNSLLIQAKQQQEPNYQQIRKEIAAILDDHNYDDGSYGPVLVRLAWHAAGTYCKNSKTGGSDGGTIRFHPEANYGANAGLHVARNLLEPIKRRHPDISYADLYTLAGVVAIEELGGPVIPWRPGRSDHPDGSRATPDGRLPDASKEADHLRNIFYRMGFDDRDIVALSGAHAIGRCHRDRSGYHGPWTRAPTSFTNEYFRELIENKWTKKKWNGPEQYEDPTGQLMMLPTDLALIKDPNFRRFVEVYAHNPQVWFEDFSRAFAKLLELGVQFSSESGK